MKELAEKCNRAAKDVMAKLLHRGIFVTINQPLDTELAKELAREFGFLAGIVSFEEDVQLAQENNDVGDKLPRSPWSPSWATWITARPRCWTPSVRPR